MKHGNEERLEQLIASYGADPARWPAAERGKFAPDSGIEDARFVDRILGFATAPALPDGATLRLLQQLEDRPPADVILFRPRASGRPGMLRYAAALPLAASLALGIYLGAMGSLDALLPAAVTGDIAATEDGPDDLGGVGEADAYAEESLT